MKVPECALSCFLENRIQFNNFPGPERTDSKEEGFILNFRQWAIVWHADKRRGLTKAVLLMMGGSWAQAEIGNYVERFLLLLVERAINHETPGLLAVLLCARNISVSLTDLDDSAFRTERRLRQVIEGAELREEDELGKLSAAHSWLAARAIREKARLSAATAFLKYAESSSFVLLKHQNDLHVLGALQKMVDSLIGQASKLCEETTMHLSTIHNLIAQKDQATNLAIAAASQEIALQARLDQAVSVEIAEASKRIAEETRKDSNAMKMIALVTMIYLPGTFIATCFSMGIFEWSAKPFQVVSPRIWVYFLFTGVLTLLTIGLFVVMTHLQGKKTDKGSGVEAGVASSTVQQSSQQTEKKKATAVSTEHVSKRAHDRSVISLAPSLSMRGDVLRGRRGNLHQGPGISDRSAYPRSAPSPSPTKQQPAPLSLPARSVRRSRSPPPLDRMDLYAYATSEPVGKPSIEQTYDSDAGPGVEIPIAWRLPESEESLPAPLYRLDHFRNRKRVPLDDTRSVVASIEDSALEQHFGSRQRVDDDTRSVVASIVDGDPYRPYRGRRRADDDASSVIARIVDKEGNIIH